ncbi:MAG: hypothetical protein CM15mP125_0740 [Gammaproteobacteria bacterium]|nr:MAG: hypothetical protein CM15mP125_0740 [Gammaproteobacteria bacterium]
MVRYHNYFAVVKKNTVHALINLLQQFRAFGGPRASILIWNVKTFLELVRAFVGAPEKKVSKSRWDRCCDKWAFPMEYCSSGNQHGNPRRFLGPFLLAQNPDLPGDMLRKLLGEKFPGSCQPSAKNDRFLITPPRSHSRCGRNSFRLNHV